MDTWQWEDYYGAVNNIYGTTYGGSECHPVPGVRITLSNVGDPKNNRYTASLSYQDPAFKLQHGWERDAKHFVCLIHLDNYNVNKGRFCIKAQSLDEAKSKVPEAIRKAMAYVARKNALEYSNMIRKLFNRDKNA